MSVARPDVAGAPSTARPYYSAAARGLDVMIPVEAGSHQVCAYAVNVGAGSSTGADNVSLGCKTVDDGPGPLTSAGDAGSYSYDTYELTDRTTAKVNVGTGNLLVTSVDATIPGTSSDTQVLRAYNSLMIGSRVPQGNTGWGWRTSPGSGYRLYAISSTDVRVVLPSGAEARFVKSGTTWQQPPGLNATLVKLSGGGGS